ncbi:uncharacterized protein ARMOST_22249 [Armillaria ostoyae]|uniref:Uncharacterized protein n=1 Tax=Armillaria ostoyae TaxID=47428 RepID=A0A284SCC0_ARMOS|nr:uncharacterized protein ARMOST_22249 [Armillaria ostoyae]
MVFQHGVAAPTPAITPRLLWDFVVVSFDTLHTDKAANSTPALSPASSVSPSVSSCSVQSLTSGTKISKPKGVGAKSFKLEDILGNELAAIKSMIFEEVEKSLNTNLSYSTNKTRNKRKIDIIRAKAVDLHPILEQFSGLWPVDDLIKLRLKKKRRL